MNEPQSSPPVSVIRLLIPAVIGGILCGVAVLNYGDNVDYPPELKSALGNPNAEIDKDELRSWDLRRLYANTALVCTIIGGVLGLCFAVGGKNSVVHWIIGLVVGVLGGCVGGLAGAFLWQMMVDNKIPSTVGGDTSTHAAIASVVIWMLIGLAVGFAYRGSPTAATGALGGVIGSLLCVMVVMLTMSSVQTNLPLPAPKPGTPWEVARVLWGLIPALIIAGFLVGGDRKQNAASQASQASQEEPILSDG